MQKAIDADDFDRAEKLQGELNALPAMTIEELAQYKGRERAAEGLKAAIDQTSLKTLELAIAEAEKFGIDTAEARKVTVTTISTAVVTTISITITTATTTTTTTTTTTAATTTTATTTTTTTLTSPPTTTTTLTSPPTTTTTLTLLGTCHTPQQAALVARAEEQDSDIVALVNGGGDLNAKNEVRGGYGGG